ncbi:DNA-binding transcriptional regulator, AcrR family [Nocardioides scoriae]|uniref:DNA-binding transcriptional regulator, AcrR family n=1 Tax=Nocardioides scoriae TaxID=642780 RepID=A0A1H1PEM5_9ACTN|nr:TetR/AcrR family transcriptional regulator [Nocardioides scoriae]SDS09594.1 DNA-binding transcriptional regulator, AcrR family [Nocardioides scoriae]
MARYGPEHKAATRRRIIETSGRRFKSDGFDGAGIAALVGDAGLTNGAFYGHFDSKDHLIATIVSEQLEAQADLVADLPVGPGSMAAYVEAYLSPAHRDDPAEGCPSAALLDEIVRQPEATRHAYTQGAARLVDAIAHHLDDDDEARQRAIGLYTLLVSSLQLARAVTDPDLSDEVLAAGRANAARIVGHPLTPASDTVPL